MKKGITTKQLLGFVSDLKKKLAYDPALDDNTIFVILSKNQIKNKELRMQFEKGGIKVFKDISIPKK